VLIEEEKSGGVRPNVSGVPTKALLPSVEVYGIFHVLCKLVRDPQEREGP
jgi:pyruvate/2-oxoglutarate dehydrogenase complex dihydrolipoamide dehydrogenase (E3) component